MHWLFCSCSCLTTHQPLWGHFVSSPKEKSKRNRRASRGEEREEYMRLKEKRNRRNTNMPLPAPVATSPNHSRMHQLTWALVSAYTKMILSHGVAYRIYLKYLDYSTPYHTASKIWTSTAYYQMMCLKIARWVANSVDHEMPHSGVSHLGLHCLLRPVCLNTYSKYSI